MTSSNVTSELQEKEFFKKIKKLTGKNMYCCVNGLLGYRNAIEWKHQLLI